MSTPCIRLRGVARKFGNVVALRNVDAEISGNIIGLLGPNGAGKSTLIKCLLGLVPFTGEAEVLGHSAQREGAAIRDRVGYMPEQDAVLPGMTAVELCSYAARLSGLPPNEAKQRAHAALYFAGLDDKRYQNVDTYSTGQRQRVKLAQALVHDPELLFLDEPTNGLDPNARADMLALIAELPQKRQCTIVLSTHLLGDVERVCDHAVIMHRGDVKYVGSVADLRKRRTSAREFVIAVKDNAARLAAALSAAGIPAEVASPLAIHAQLRGEDTIAQLLAIAGHARVQVRGVEEHRDTVEAAFLRIIGAAEHVDRDAVPAHTTGKQETPHE